jgi:hypothetical protein
MKRRIGKSHSNKKRKRENIQRFEIMYRLSRLAIQMNSVPRERSPNQHRGRNKAIAFVRSWDDEMFQRQFRLSRTVFNTTLQKISSSLERNETMGVRSSGSFIKS